MIVTEDAVKVVNRTKDLNRQVCAVGTTVMRAIESTVSTDGHLKEYEGWTNKFIFPPYDFTVANAMVSNFHMPLSTLLMIVAAFGGYEQVMEAYNVALKEDYRFGTYGDAMLITDRIARNGHPIANICQFSHFMNRLINLQEFHALWQGCL